MKELVSMHGEKVKESTPVRSLKKKNDLKSSSKGNLLSTTLKSINASDINGPTKTTEIKDDQQVHLNVGEETLTYDEVKNLQGNLILIL